MARSPSVQCDGAFPSAAAELAWLLDLLVQTARYAEPALDELDRTLLPGVAVMRATIKTRFAALWTDSVPGCPELLVEAASGGCIGDQDPRRLFAWLSKLPPTTSGRYDLFAEPGPSRRMIRGRLALLNSDIRIRRMYRDLLAEVWERAEPAWRRRGVAVALKAATEWNRRLRSVKTAFAFVQLMPPRHPLTRIEQPRLAGLFRRQPRISLVPAYVCMSGGLVEDVGDRILVVVPASALEPARRSRDAAFVSDRLRVLAEPTRVHILIHLMSAPSGVMETTRALRLSQPTVSEHIRVLVAAGLVRRVRNGSRTAYQASNPSLERLIEDARATLGRWAG